MIFMNRQEEAEFEQAQLESHSCVDPTECRICTEKRNNINTLNNRYEMLKDLEVMYIRLVEIEYRSKELNIKPSYIDLYEQRLSTIQNELKLLRKVLYYDTK